MAPRSSSKTSGRGFQPAYDAATYRDLLLFEERLKTNAASLNRRKHRYQLFLAQLLVIITFLASEVLLQTNVLSIPYAVLLRAAFSDLYTERTDISIHPYFTTGLLFVSVTTLVLFFASGMYSEKIGYPNRYVPHANRALRSFNMYLNVRQPPLRSKLPAFLNPFTLLFPRPTPASVAPAAPPRRRSPSPPSSRTKRSSSVPIPPIPPASNPRGELIFSSRVDRGFRESYERYRAVFERRREERERMERDKTWTGWILSRLPWARLPPISPAIPSVSNGGSRLRTESGQSDRGEDSLPSSRRVSVQGSLSVLAQPKQAGQIHPLASVAIPSDGRGLEDTP
ncbi:Spo7-like protein-domain-containing protein [Rhodofomes roseus]|uniref:Transmembrane protein 188 n=1 Tax=Rhodofomes roseus TaxID=34475 RepID=A0ABQ8K767_9APHY|nr:Spo7-like protein-domain-containing protein [Rhodofomes roseus]KAH9833105.1 Spo7-like protein-domain-containing protein [Rhodofomes roseus]